jgi:hypothetical protein
MKSFRFAAGPTLSMLMAPSRRPCRVGSVKLGRPPIFALSAKGTSVTNIIYTKVAGRSIVAVIDPSQPGHHDT